MNLHRAEPIPQWERTSEKDRNIWQRIAHKTRGVITPANVVSLSGLALTLSGLQDYKKGNKQRATAKIILGRACDIADGLVAEYTQTKSPLGEAVDATVDKISMGYGLYALSETDTLPVLVTASFLAQNLINTAATAIAKQRGQELHPSAEGKITTLLQWAAIGGYVIDSVMHDQAEAADTMSFTPLASHLTAVGATLLGTVVNVQYAGIAFQGSSQAPSIDI